jgi:CheY-like chemotaxis protein
MKVMVVDDEHDVKILFQQKFRKEIRAGTIILHFAYSGETALEYLEKEKAGYSLILSDINMPGMDGLELLRAIRQKFSQLHVWMITAYGDELNYQQAVEYGCNEYMTKPLDFDTLKEKILHNRGSTQRLT